VNRISALLLLTAIHTAVAGNKPASITVNFIAPDKYTDVSLSGADTERMRQAVYDGLRDYLDKLAKTELPPGDQLTVDVIDIDMAGNFEPWRTPNLNRTRFIRDVYRPKFVLKYRWLDKGGTVKAEREETVSDLNYLQRLETRQFQDNDPLKYEKTLLGRWFRERFAGEQATKPD
jgi:Protein of unknown function (DUF3016)